MKLFKGIKIGVLVVATMMFLSIAIPPVTFAQVSTVDNPPVKVPPVINAPTYTNISAELHLPYNLSLENTTSGYVDPIISQANIWKAQGLDDSQIVDEFAKEGVTFNPKTYAWDLGHSPTSEELKYITLPMNPLTLKPYNYSSLLNGKIAPQALTGQAFSGLWTTYSTFCGFDYYMEPGDVTSTTSGTSSHYVTTHIGDSSSCLEVGVMRTGGAPYLKVYTYYSSPTYTDSVPHEYLIYPSTSDFHEYSIIYTGTHNSNGYYYTVKFDGQPIRSEYLTSLNCQISQCDEANTNNGVFNNDNNPSMFESQTIYQYSGGLVSHLWDNTIPSFAQRLSPGQYYYVMGGNSWFDELWIHS